MEKFLTVFGLTIAYSDVNSDNNQTIFFIHGNSNSKNVFKNQLKSDEFKNYRLMAIDLPGHGLSDQCHDKDCYSIFWYSKIVKQFIQKLNLTNIIIVGHSLGGHIAIGASDPSYTSGLMIVHTPPLNYAQDAVLGFLQSPHFACFFNGEVCIGSVQNLFKAIIYNKEAYDQTMLTDFINTHKDCRRKLGMSVQDNMKLGEVDKLRLNLFPLAVLVTDNDPIINNEYIEELNLPAWKDKLIVLPDSGHFPQLEKSDAFNNEIIDFIKHINH